MEISPLLCPICREEMVDPVFTEHGMIYDRKCIEKWMKKEEGHTDPLTRKVFVTNKLQSIPLIREIVKEVKLLTTFENLKIKPLRLSCDKEELYVQAREREDKGNYFEAYPFYWEAMREGSLDGQIKVAWYYLFGMSTVKIDYFKAFGLLITVNEISPLCEEACLWLGYCYGYGKGVNYNPSRALNLLERAAKSGKSLFFQGIIHRREKSDSKKIIVLYSEGIPLLKKEAERDPISQYFLGMHYCHDCSQQKQGFAYFLSSAERGVADAQNSIAVSFEDGLGVEKDKLKALSYYQQAADQNHGGSIVILGHHIESPEHIQRAADECDNRIAQHLLGVIHEEKDEQLAIQYYIKSAAKGFEKSRTRLEDLMRKRIHKELEEEMHKKGEELKPEERSCRIS
jgi:TPR repeat protein